MASITRVTSLTGDVLPDRAEPRQPISSDKKSPVTPLANQRMALQSRQGEVFFRADQANNRID
jgi:hypothetical protein